MGRIGWRPLQFVTRVMRVLAGVTVVLLSLLVAVTVVLRYFLGLGVGWSTELSTYLLFVMALCAAPGVQELDRHIRIDLLVHRLPKRARLPLQRVTELIGFLVCAVVAGYAGNYTLTLYERGDAVARVLSVPKWTFMAFIAFCFTVLALVFLAQLLGHRRSADGGEDEPLDVPDAG